MSNSNTLYLYVVTEIDSSMNRLCDYNVIKDDDWVILRLYGELKYNYILYREFIKRFISENAYSYIVIKDSEGDIYIVSPSIRRVPTLSSDSVDFCEDEIESKLEEIVKHV